MEEKAQTKENKDKEKKDFKEGEEKISKISINDSNTDDISPGKKGKKKKKVKEEKNKSNEPSSMIIKNMAEIKEDEGDYEFDIDNDKFIKSSSSIDKLKENLINNDNNDEE